MSFRRTSNVYDNVGCFGVLFMIFLVCLFIFVEVAYVEYTVEYWVDVYKKRPIGTTDIPMVVCIPGIIVTPGPFFFAAGTYIHKHYMR